MESDSITNLIELLKSQFALYSEIKNILTLERQSVTNWRIEETSKFNADKKRLTRKEAILEEARITLTDRIKGELNLSDSSLLTIISACTCSKKAAILSDLREKLLQVAVAINEESSTLKVLYSTNLKLINEMYAQMGYLSTNKYGAAPRAGIPSTISALG